MCMYVCKYVCLCPVGILTVTHQETARDAAIVHLGLTIRITDILVKQGGLTSFHPFFCPGYLKLQLQDSFG